ncbi:hypothetical protein PCANC_18844 [Puccinia coronata f. sp. avenae]|uniref:Uncharacterized protein n=1 Tax=Puccinia coronata f. sp. avenae TaxID=200324 RepID=A0A2N5U8F9_9BASI|nr:hypothetical protein PCANC_17028 [Puccinia coronata f. sp. avenae]PLW34025.1 hypothetical protein PCANC_18844 [Puccinia coronata f. sp. avenae]
MRFKLPPWLEPRHQTYPAFGEEDDAVHIDRVPQFILVFFFVFTGHLGLVAGHYFDPFTVVGVDVLPRNHVGEVDREGNRSSKSLASTAYGWASDLVGNVGSIVTSGYQRISWQRKKKGNMEGVHELLNEVTTFSEAVQKLSARIENPSTAGSSSDKLYLSQCLKLISECYQDIIGHYHHYFPDSEVEVTEPIAYGHFREAASKDLESKLDRLAVEFVSHTIPTVGFNQELFLNSENIIFQTIGLFYKHGLITVKDLRGFFKNPKALKKMALRTMNHSPLHTENTYPNYIVDPNLQSMAEYWELLYSVDILRALDKKSQALVTYFALTHYMV